jgi:hypothetical protein
MKLTAEALRQNTLSFGLPSVKAVTAEGRSRAPCSRRFATGGSAFITALQLAPAFANNTSNPAASLPYKACTETSLAIPLDNCRQAVVVDRKALSKSHSNSPAYVNEQDTT